jgi:hypothetical protein
VSANFNFCTIFQESPRTEDARSTVTDEWDENNQSWDSDSRIIQEFSGDTLDELIFQERGSQGAWRDTARATPEYDSSDRLTLCTLESKQQDGSYVNSLRNDFQYNANGRPDTLLTQAWDSTDANPNGEWVNSFRSTFEYDGNGNDTQQVDQFWNSSNQTWINSQRFTRTYDSQDRLEEELQEVRDFTNGGWENSSRSQFTYNSDSTVELEESWDGSMWVNDARFTTMLNSSDLPTETLTEEWDGSDWINDERSTNSYTTHNSTQKFEMVLDEEWDGGAGAWVNDSRTRFSYTSIIPVELAHFEAQRIEEGAVRLTWQTASETNNTGFAVQRQTSPSASWSQIQFVEGAGTTSEPQSYRFTDRGVPYAAETVHYRLRQVDLDGSTHLSDVVAVRLGAPERLALLAPFPNPAQSQATVRYELPEATDVEIGVYDLLGRRVATPVDKQGSAGRSQFQFRTRQLPSGTYLLRLQTSDQVQTQRLTVVK